MPKDQVFEKHKLLLRTSKFLLEFLNSKIFPLGLYQEDPIRWNLYLEHPVHVARVTVAGPWLLLLCWHWLHGTPCPLLVSPVMTKSLGEGGGFQGGLHTWLEQGTRTYSGCG